MTIHSMTGFAQVKGHISDQLAFSISLKSVNHRFLDLHLRMPSNTDALEMKFRRVLKEKMARGHVELTFSLERASSNGFALNRQVVSGYVEAFRAAAREHGISGDPDLNAVFRIPGALEGFVEADEEDMSSAALPKLEEAIEKLNQMRADEGKAIERELRDRISRLAHATSEVDKYRDVVLKAYMEKLHSRMTELMG